MQYFYLICTNFDETTCPRKVFLQEHQAVTWGRRLATKIANDDFYACMEVALYKQPITTIGELEYVKTLEPYKKPIDSILYAAACGIANGSDTDIDIKRSGDPGVDTTFG
jgi:hypothetical protein